MRHVMLGRLAIVVCAASVLAGCGLLEDPDDTAGSTSAAPQPESSVAPSATSEASEAGGICQYLDFASLSQATGQPFTVAVAGGEGEVTSCVVQTTDGSFPDITFTKAKTATDEDTYRDEIPPEKSTEVDDLGKAAYSAVRKAVPGGGPVVEIGWLTKGHMYSLRYTTVVDTDTDAAKATVEALVETARAIDKAAAKDEDKD